MMRESFEILEPRIVMENLNERDKEDRISTLPDEIIHNILSMVEADVAVQTCVLSKRWVNIWSTLPFLNFEPNRFDRNGVYYRTFVTNLLTNRNQQSNTCSITIDCIGFDESLTKTIVDYAISHKVEQFLINCATIKSSITSSFLRKLSLSFCKVMVNWSLPSLETLCLFHCSTPPLLNWSFPSLTTLSLDNATFSNPQRVLSFEGFNRLKKLTMRGYWRMFSELEVIIIKTPKLASLIICYDSSEPLTCTFMVSAPNLSSFQFRGRCVPVYYVVDGLPLLKQVKIDICIGNYEWKGYNSQEKNQVIQNLFSLFRDLQGTKFLICSFETIQVLSRLLCFSVYQSSPFSSLNCLNILRSCYTTRCLKEVDLPDHVILYLLSSSPHAKIFIEEYWDNIRQYDPIKKRFLRETDGGRVIKEKVKAATLSSTKIDASNKVPKPEVKNKRNSPPQRRQAMSNVQGNGDGIHKGLGVIPPAVVRGALNDVVRGALNHKSSSYWDKDNLSLWEGHRIYSEYVDLVTRIKEKHPETFEHFAPQTDIMYTTGLNTLCSIVRAFSEDCGSKFTAAYIARYKGLFSDLDKWGFNTTWLVNSLSNTGGLSFLCRPSLR